MGDRTTDPSRRRADETVEPADIARFQKLVGRQLGLRFTEPASSATRRLEQVLSNRLATYGQSAPGYLDWAERDPAPEVNAWARELTVTETYFLRHIEQFNALTGTVVTQRLRAGRDPARLSLLSAGCATGEEAYSLAIALRQQLPASQPSILGIDVNQGALEKARRAHYASWSLRAVPEEMRRRWFITEGGHISPDPSVRTLVTFAQHNILLDDPEIWAAGRYDAIFCRNVLMYLQPEAMGQVLERIARSLQPGGFLFLGSAETLRGLPTPFVLRESHGAFFYQKGPATAPATPEPSVLPVAAQPVPPRPAPRVAGGPGSGPAGSGPAGASPAGSSPPGDRYDDVLALLATERFTDALDQLNRLEPRDGGHPSGEDVDALLLRAALLTHSGQLADAESACRRLLRADPASSGAHLLLGIVRECSGDDAEAMEHCQAAARLDPEFAMPQIHLGRLARRSGRAISARRHLTTAIDLLPDETALRMLLFGGGFEREALISLCRTQLAGLLATTGGGR